MSAHLFVDISSHGFGHLGTTAPVLVALRERLPTLRLTVRSGLPLALLQARIGHDFTHIDQASDVGFVQQDAIRIDHVATRKAYQRFHQDFQQRIHAEADLLARLKPDLVFSNVSYLPLAGAKAAGVAALALCSLNWLDLLHHFYGRESWAQAVMRDAESAYAAADLFLILTPGMPMPDLPRRRVIGPVATVAPEAAREPTRRMLGIGNDEQAVLVAMGGFELAVPVDLWPSRPGLRFLVPETWNCTHPAAIAYGTHEFSFGALLRAADVVLTKPGYGTFAEAACTGIPLFYIHRDDWPEQDFLIAWLAQNGICREVSRDELASGTWIALLGRVLQMPRPASVNPSGAVEAASILAAYLER